MAFDLQSPECRSAFVGGAVEETTRRAMQAEIERLGSAGLVARRGSIDVVLARGSEIPALLRELRTMVDQARLTDALFRTNHASNYLPLGGRLPVDRLRIVQTIDAALSGSIPLRPEWSRGL